jgi:hypothetical protein
LPTLNILITLLGSYFGQLPVRPQVYEVPGGWRGDKGGREEEEETDEEYYEDEDEDEEEIVQPH